ncbi:MULTISPECIES: putative lateral flagellar export/assembly protein LafU [Rahnella]|uniref:Lateral flagellar export/assembly protein LafU n=1 Tax=Rahnella laticis TaxID=2787622 RepID=A0ABS0E036_9GAMM|nr:MULTISPECIES: putative lateral flagellar export/assembly protein LafU [Rahnella]MBF7978446.1 putative lateral flagellar export/assembly protein LafU [Rahnella laticis]MBF7998536.1 putative lateral flagellar export/assembly protein LafU [Rahnella sp. LAC-M12]
MRSSKNTHNTTIIKRGSRKGHSGVHGGAWKVAFADFTLAMMALFMVLWIVGSVSEEERKEIVAQINSQSIFSSTVFDPIDMESASGGGKLIGTAQPVTDASAAQNPNDPRGKDADGGESLDSVMNRSHIEMEELTAVIEKITAENNAQANLKIEVIPQGLRILLQDDRQKAMFERGSSTLTPFFGRLLTELAPVFNKLDNQIIITGHTDAVRFRDQERYNNWNLSGDRALVARRALEGGGLDQARVIQVSSMADRMLLDPENPESAANRRIEITVLTKAAADTLFQFYGYHGEKVVKPITERLEADGKKP